MNSQFWRDRPVLVTGASGLLGGCVLSRLLDHGADTVCLIRDWVPQSEIVRAGMYSRAKAIRGDVRDRSLLERIVAEYEIDTVFHLAAQTVVEVANGSPVGTFEANIQGTWNVLEACRVGRSVKQVVVASSDKAYGSHSVLPYSEEMPLQGRHPYDVSKSCTDLIAQCYAHSFDLPVAVTRCGNLYGGGDLNWNRIVPGTIRSIVRGQRPVIRSDGKYIRDYFYVVDAAAAYMLLAEHLSDNPALRGEAFNFSNESQLTVLELVRTICALMGAHAHPEIHNRAANEIRHQYLSASKARELLGWTPLFTLEEALQQTIDWYVAFLEHELEPCLASS